MNDGFFSDEFNTQRDQWEKLILAELKLNEIGSRDSKKLINGLIWPTISLERKSQIQLPANEAWKKASTTFVNMDPNEIEDVIGEELAGGVRNFFFHTENLNDLKWRSIQSALRKHDQLNEIEVFMLGDSHYQDNEFKVVSNIISGKDFHDQGGHSIQELALMAKNLIKNIGLITEDIYLGVYVDSHFFHNIAKIRAAKLMAGKIIEEFKLQRKIKVVALTSFVGWTLFERYSNMLRNETAVASAYIGGADHIQSTGYNTIIELESKNFIPDEHSQRSRRMARNTSHVLALESMLGVVEDAAYGSFHLENLTQALCEESWKLMQGLLNGLDISKDLSQVRQKRLEMLKTRKIVVSGTNDYPDVKERLDITLKSSNYFRTSRIFEELRLTMENAQTKPEVYIALYGEYSALNGRLNFVKNYFEILGLSVHELGHSELNIQNFIKNLESRTEEIIVMCAQDEHYPELREVSTMVQVPYKYIAGKFEMNGYQNLFGGQDIYGILEKLVSSVIGNKT